MNQISRRTFLDQSAKTTIGLSAAMVSANSKRVMGANDRIVLAGIGIGGRNTSLLRGFIKWDEIDIKTLCDANLNRGRLQEMSEFITNARGKKPVITQEMNEVFDDKDIQAVVIATPDHWHGPATVFACQAGKDVYVEKPISHNIWEGRKMVEAAKKYNRVVQCGTQNRSAEYNYHALDYIKSGKLGDIHLCKVFNMKPGGPYHIGEPAEVPDGFDYDKWLGPAATRPYNPSVVDGWHMFWDFTAGDLADDGAHQLDLARMLIQRDTPSAVHSSGGKIAFNDDREVPDTLVTTYEFGTGLILTFELTQWTPYMKKTPADVRSGDQFPLWFQSATRIELYGTKGMMIIGRHGGGWQVFSNDGEVVEQEYGRFPDFEVDDPHKQNFIDCIKSRGKPNADIETGHYSACLIHYASVSNRVGNRQLKFDGRTETFIGDEEANMLVKRFYRPPYVIPEQV